MISGEYYFKKEAQRDENFQKLGAGSKQINYNASISRQAALLGGGNKN
jgi:hypothetical protein